MATATAIDMAQILRDAQARGITDPLAVAEMIEMAQAEADALKKAERKRAREPRDPNAPRFRWSRAAGRVWDGLGRDVTAAMTAREALERSGQDFEAVKVQLFAPRTTGEPIAIPGQFANIREDTGDLLGLVSEKYQLLQNRDVYSILDDIVGEGLRFETAGALRGGKRVWMLARMPEVFSVAAEDEIHPYLLATNGFDASLAFRILPTPVRVVCENTLNMALSQGKGQGFSWNHVGNLEARKEAARQMLGLARDHFRKFGEGAKELAGAPISEAQARAYFASLYPDQDPENYGLGVSDYRKARAERDSARIPAERERLMELFEAGAGNDLRGVRGTAWAAYNAVTEHLDHDRPDRENLRDRRSATQFEDVLFGQGRSLKMRAFDLALGLARGDRAPEAPVTVPVGARDEAPKPKAARRRKDA